MKYIIEEIEFDLSRPVNKWWYSKFKKDLLKNRTEFIEEVISDAKNKKQIKYSQRYYACVKFIKHTTNLTFEKIQTPLYIIKTIACCDFYYMFTVEKKSDLYCQNIIPLLSYCNDHNCKNDKSLGYCKNECCEFIVAPNKKNKSFEIKWL